MDDISINYIIATYDGMSGGCGYKRDKHDNDSEMVLQKHFEVLLTCLKPNTLIKQITLILNKDTNQSYREYYKIDKYLDEIKKLGISVILLPISSKLLFKTSYSQYLYIYSKYPNFDFNILIEDDWVPSPNLDCFDRILLNEYRKYNNKGFLSAWVPDWFCQQPRHSAISVGIISGESMKKAYDKFSMLQLNHKNRLSLGQSQFSRLFEELHDYSNSGENFMIPFWETSKGLIYEYAMKLSKKYLLIPIQLLNLNKYKYIVGPYEKHSLNLPPANIFEWVQKCNYEKGIPKNIIRDLVKSDYEQYSTLMDSNITRIKYENFIDNVLGSNHEIIVKENEGKLVATGTLIIEEKITYGGCKMGHIENVFVDPNYRKRGIGEKIVNELLARSKRKKCYRVDLNCKAELEKFYKKMDFKEKHICMNIYFKENFN